jgi:hypothetical protein
VDTNEMYCAVDEETKTVEMVIPRRIVEAEILREYGKFLKQAMLDDGWGLLTSENFRLHLRLSVMGEPVEGPFVSVDLPLYPENFLSNEIKAQLYPAAKECYCSDLQECKIGLKYSLHLRFTLSCMDR